MLWLAYRKLVLNRNSQERAGRIAQNAFCRAAAQGVEEAVMTGCGQGY